MNIENYNNDKHRDQVISIWKSIFRYKQARNNPAFSIDNKLTAADNLFFVAIEENKVIGTIMAGYDGHRGWIYSLAVLPEKRKSGVGTNLLKYAENELKKMGCVKINLQILVGNDDAVKFYLKNNYSIEERISMGKEIKENIEKVNGSCCR